MWIECFAAQMRALHQRLAPIYQSDKKLLDGRNYKTIIIGWITGSVKTVKKNAECLGYYNLLKYWRCLGNIKKILNIFER